MELFGSWSAMVGKRKGSGLGECSHDFLAGKNIQKFSPPPVGQLGYLKCSGGPTACEGSRPRTLYKPKDKAVW